MSTQRVTTANLDAIVARINTMTNSPLTPYASGADGKYEPQAGCYHLRQAYGGYALHQMSTEVGCSGITDVLSRGHVPKKELAELMHAFIRGLEVDKGIDRIPSK